MNERIKELIKQATTIEEHKWGVSYDNFDKEKTGVAWVGLAIAKHFGVEK